jgi:hypothetical protein
MFMGEPITIRSSYKNVWNRGWRYIGLYTLQGLVIVGAPTVVFLGGLFAMIAAKVSGFSDNDGSPLFGGLLFLLFIILAAFAVWMLLRFCLAFPASVVEQTTAWNALKRGIRLSHGTRGRILVLFILGLVLNWMLTWAVTFIVVIAVAMIPSLQGQKHAQTVGMIMMFSLYGTYFAVKALIKPIYGIALTLFYFDQRIRKEAFDIEWLMQQAGMTLPPQPAPPPDLQSAEQMPQPAMPVEPIEPVVVVPVESDLSQTFPVQSQDLASAPGEVKA